MTYEEMMIVIEAAKEGKEIQSRLKHCEHGVWDTVDPTLFNFGDCDYRVKPEPKLRPYANARGVH